MADTQVEEIKKRRHAPACDKCKQLILEELPIIVIWARHAELYCTEFCEAQSLLGEP